MDRQNNRQKDSGKD
jgi:hypothetical protein